MKKTLAAVAVLGAFAGSALAADVQLYGIVDTGLRYLHSDMEYGVDKTYGTLYGVDATDKFEMASGMQSGSRFGFKGTEDLGNGLTVGFILESQFDADDGSLSDNDHFFRREASIYLEGSFGKFAMGRMGSMNSGVSSWGKHGVLTAFGTSWNSYIANADTVFGNSGIWDNMIAYETPSFAGFKVFAQYGMGNRVSGYNLDDEEVSWGDENESTSDRYYAIGASYTNGALDLYLSVDSVNYSSRNADGKFGDTDDAWTVRLGGSYDFEVVKLFVGASYFDEARLSNYSGAASDWVNALPQDETGYLNASTDKIKGWSVSVSGNIPLAGGNLLLGAAYLDAEAADSMANFYAPAAALAKDSELSRIVVSAGYDYPLSKRTNVYGMLTYNRDSIDNIGGNDLDPTVYGAMIGLRHKF